MTTPENDKMWEEAESFKRQEIQSSEDELWKELRDVLKPKTNIEIEMEEVERSITDEFFERILESELKYEDAFLNEVLSSYNLALTPDQMQEVKRILVIIDQLKNPPQNLN